MPKDLLPNSAECRHFHQKLTYVNLFSSAKHFRIDIHKEANFVAIKTFSSVFKYLIKLGCYWLACVCVYMLLFLGTKESHCF